MFRFLCLFTLIISPMGGFLSAQISAQTESSNIIYTHHFTEILAEAHFDFYKPLEKWYHVRPKKKDRFLSYDLVLLNDEEDQEVRYMFKTYSEDALDQFPHVNNMRIIHHIATNDESADITTLVLDRNDAQKRYNADWATVHYFTPKITFSRRPFGAMLTLHSEGKSTANVFILYEDPSFDVLSGFHQLRFRE